MAFALAICSATSAFVGQPVMPQPRAAASVVRMSSSLLPDMYRERWAGDHSHTDATLSTKYDAATYVGALLGASAVAAVGVGVSSMSTDFSLSLLGSTGMFNEDVRKMPHPWTDGQAVLAHASLPACFCCCCVCARPPTH